MKFFLYLILFVFISCSHTPIDHKSFEWKQEIVKNKKKQGKIKNLFTWHQKRIEKYQKSLKADFVKIKKLKKNIQTFNSQKKGLQAKKAKLKLGRAEDNILNKHLHYLEDQERFDELIIELEKLKKELESHNCGHDH